AHQPNRRLRLAAEPQTGRREVSALTDARKTLAYDFFRILRAPHLALSHDQMRQLTATGFWPLYRFDPRRADEGKLPLALDSRPPSDALAETLLQEQRFRRLNAQQPEVAEQLWRDAAADLQKRYDFLAQLAGKAEKSTSE
ncbi:hypothetical protein N8V85_21805, partial [Enterobacter hormaechei subsp. hoffmannii]|nr:hypothetical protein [Enterobacter hormaechei subsp. hoffmannii]